MIIQRHVLRGILEALIDSPVLLVEGPSRAGKSVLAAQVHKASMGQTLLLDALSPALDNLLRAPEAALDILGRNPGRILIVDDADREEGILETLAAPPAGSRVLLIGTRFPSRLRNTLPRIELQPFGLSEVGRERRNLHWLRGGYPEAWAAPSDQAALAWLSRQAQTVAEAAFTGSRLPWAPGRARNLISMLAQGQGEPANESALAQSLGISRPSLARAIEALESAGILRRLPSLPSPTGRRTRLSPLVYIRDSGLLHALLNLASAQDLLASPRLAASWEGYALEEALKVLPAGLEAANYRTQDGARLELVLSREGRPVYGAALRWARPSGAPPKGLLSAARDLGLDSPRLVLPEAEERENQTGETVMGLGRFLEEVSSL